MGTKYVQRRTTALSGWAGLVALVGFMCLWAGVESAAVVDVQRMIQYDLGGEPLGSRKATFDLHASLMSSGSDLSRVVVVVPYLDLDVSAVQDLLDRKGSVSALLFVLPQDFATGAYNTAAIEQLEQVLIHRKVPFPVYFAVEDENLETMIQDLRQRVAAGIAPSPTTGGYRLSTKAREGQKLESTSLENHWSWLKGAESATGERNPTIAIVAYYDSISVSPGLSVGSDSNGSSIASLLELARLFSRLYEDAKTKGNYNILFLLTAGAALGYNGAEHWLATVDARIFETVEFALCLDSLGTWGSDPEEGLHLHISRPPKDPRIQALHAEFTAVAKELDIPFSIVQKKVDLSSEQVAWEHEQFSKKKIVAATLSSRAAPPPPLGISTLGASGSASPNATSAALAVRLIGEALARHMYGQAGRQISVFGDESSRSVNLDFVQHWMNLLSSVPRNYPYHLFAPNKLSSVDNSKTEVASSKLIEALKSQLQHYTSEITTSPFRVDSRGTSTGYTFYSETHAQIEICEVASISLDIWSALGITGYLIALWAALSVSTRGITETMKVFQVQEPVKKRH